MPYDDLGMFELDSDPEVLKYLWMKPLEKIEQSQEIIRNIRQQYLDHGIGRWVMIEKSTNSFVGWTGLKFVTTTINGHTNFYDLGYRLQKKYWGKGYATESAKASVDYAFNVLKQKDIYAMAHVDNIASRKILEKTGLTYINDFLFQERPSCWYKVSQK